jgi:hypothetical protein
MSTGGTAAESQNARASATASATTSRGCQRGVQAYAREKASRPLANDPVEDLRRGWDLHIAFGLAHPDAFALLYSAPSVAAYRPVIHEGVALLQGLVARIAEAGRLRVDVAHATGLLHAAGTGIAITLAATAPEERDPRLSETMREAILTAITVPASAEAPNGRRDAVPAPERVAVHAVALQALLTETPSVLSPAEQRLLSDWLDQLATTRSPGAPMRPASDTRRS